MASLKTINYYPSLREEVGSINAAISASYMEECFKEKGKLFYKFMEPCGHSEYIKGESVVEELQMTSTEFRTAFKHIGMVYKSKKAYNQSKDKFQGKMYLSYYDRISKLTYYMRNDDLVNGKFEEIENPKIDATLIEQSQFVEMTSENIRDDELQDGIIDYKTKINNKTYIQTKTNDYTDQKIDRQTQTNEMLNINMGSETKVEAGMNTFDKKLEVPFESIRELFNKMCHSYEQIIEWSTSQKKKLVELWIAYGEELEAFRVAFEKLENSDFLSGRIKRWKAQLDWVFKPEHFGDILAGKYRNFRKPEKYKQDEEEDMLHRSWDFEEIDRLEQERINRRLEARLCL